MERNAALMTARGGRREGQGPGATRAQVLCIISLNLPGNKNQWRHLLKLQILGSLLWALWFQFDKHGTELHQESTVLNKILGCAGRARGGAERVCRFLPSSSCQNSVYVSWQRDGVAALEPGRASLRMSGCNGASAVWSRAATRQDLQRTGHS